MCLRACSRLSHSNAAKWRRTDAPRFLRARRRADLSCRCAPQRRALLGVLGIYRREVRPFPDRQAAFVNESEAAVAPDETDTKAEMLGRHDRTHRFAYTAGSKASASCQRQSTSSPAGSARANAPAWPAQACMRWTSRDVPAASRIAAVRALCTG